jgi:hypothetical protein
MFSDNPEIGGIGEGIAEGGGGVSEQAREKLAEEIQRVGEQQKRDKKDEKTAKKRDNKVADFLRQFIKSGNDNLVGLIAQMVAMNIPVTFILGILSLNHDEIIEILNEHLSSETRTDDLLEMKNERNLPSIMTNETQERIEQWGNQIFQDASTDPVRHLTTVAHHGGVDSASIQLSALMLEEYLQKNGKEQSFDQIKAFTDLMLRSILHKLHDIADAQGKLPEPDENTDDDDE